MAQWLKPVYLNMLDTWRLNMRYWSIQLADTIAVGNNCNYVTRIKKYFKRDYKRNYYVKYRKWVYAVYNNGIEELLEQYTMPYRLD